MKLRSFMIAVAVAAIAAAGMLVGPPAGAQEGKGIITLEAAHPAGTSVHFIVRVTWENDGHPAADAVVTATAVGSDGTQLTPVTLAPIDEDGRYANPIDFGSPGCVDGAVHLDRPDGYRRGHADGRGPSGHDGRRRRLR